MELIKTYVKCGIGYYNQKTYRGKVIFKQDGKYVYSKTSPCCRLCIADALHDCDFIVDGC